MEHIAPSLPPVDAKAGQYPQSAGDGSNKRVLEDW